MLYLKGANINKHMKIINHVIDYERIKKL
jgi:hypothetical protein